MRREINNLISVAWTFIRLRVYKVFNYKGIYFHTIERISPNVVLEVNRGGILKLGDRVRIHSGSKIKVRSGGECNIDKAVRLNYNCMIFCHEKVSIGAGTEFGPNVLVYDHDHDFRCTGGLAANKFKSAPVVIGKNVWVGANTIILCGTTIGDNCVIGAGSVVKGDIAEGTVFIQKREFSSTIADSEY